MDILQDFVESLLFPVMLALGGLLLMILIMLLLPGPWNAIGPIIFVLMVTGVLPVLIYDAYKKSRGRDEEPNYDDGDYIEADYDEPE